MTELEKLGLGEIFKLSNELGSELRNLALMKKEDIDNDKHIYPLSGKCSDIERWVEAIEENVEKTEEL